MSSGDKGTGELRQRRGAPQGDSAPAAPPVNPLHAAPTPGSAPQFRMSTAAVVVGVLAWRVAGALLQQTYFVPDEHWQGPEVPKHKTLNPNPKP
ncbi:hypothetical protein T484DRAFT_2208426 [Baffinella frigidus]|nr:hypothetical protein T484DRAFT_2208426 [Cryptophyta sp. CCMP2293]